MPISGARAIRGKHADRPRQKVPDVAHGFTEDEVKQIIGFATFWVMNTMFSASALVALADE